ncbi:polysaccharide pyruvyl transferase CsaB [Acidaminobacter sp. JC074]|uniref:polysaccharide pyruvyl transferase CsaB n=1 Tax=Acidaminobacter sp. JC074 TaxID=2530199 RepID=UPI001F0DA908|nr:polysaccharide pyruvyl transferase CsaB [Acidaminobacter sp. JC074]MCH4889181.1 polysaccharide pyruvyl transferase CsaB [Acidaminobacter sp. JC074]
MKKLVISGYHGFGNIGDEAILKAMLTEFNKMDKDIELTVLSQRPEETARNFNVKTVDRSSIFKVIKTIYQSDILISGGGSLLQESTGRLSIYYYLFIYFVAMIFKKKTIIFSHGIGPIYRKRSKKLVQFVFNRAACISVRDKYSKEELISYGVKPYRIDVTADPVISFKKFGSELGLNLFKKYGNFDPNLKTIGFAVKGSKVKDVTDDFVAVIDKLKQEPCNIVLIPFHYSEDLSLIEKIIEKSSHELISINEKHNVSEIFSIVEAVDVLVSVRLHALIFSAVSETPMVGITYDPKIDAFLESIHEEAVCSIDDMQTDLLADKIHHHLDNSQAIKNRLKSDVFKYKVLLTKYNSSIEAMID